MALTRDISSWPFTSTLSSAVTFTTLPMTPQLREPEVITASKEFYDCEFSWYSAKDGAHGVSIGKTLPAIPEEASHQYPREDFTVENVAKIPCRQVLGSYIVRFER